MRNKRNLGLDIIRCIAIVFVLFCHGEFFLRGIVDTRIFGYVGVLSVEIFFVLSGFLIGRGLIDSIVKNGTWSSVRKFYINRVLRTIPLYYLMLLITAIVKKMAIPVSCVFFWQNFDSTQLGFLPVSWSLSVEEWFYLLVPIVLMLAMKLFSGKLTKQTVFWIVTLCICACSFGIRIHTVFHNEVMWDYGVRKQIFLRLDSIMLGVALAGVKIYFNNVYDKIFRNWKIFLGAVTGLVGMALLYYFYLGVEDNFSNSPFWLIMFFSIVPFLCCFVIAYMEKNDSINARLKNTFFSKIITELSVLSYAIYLVHWNVFEQVSRYYNGWTVFVICVGVSIILSKIMNVVIEEPIMKLRKKITG